MGTTVYLTDSQKQALIRFRALLEGLSCEKVSLGQTVEIACLFSWTRFKKISAEVAMDAGLGEMLKRFKSTEAIELMSEISERSAESKESRQNSEKISGTMYV